MSNNTKRLALIDRVLKNAVIDFRKGDMTQRQFDRLCNRVVKLTGQPVNIPQEVHFERIV